MLDGASTICADAVMRLACPAKLSRLIEVIVLAFLTPSGRKVAAKVMRDAAAAMHRRI